MKSQTFILIFAVGLLHWAAGELTENDLSVKGLGEPTTERSGTRKTLGPSNAALQLLLSIPPKLANPESFPAVDKTRSKLHDILNNLKYSDISDNPIEELKRELFFNLPKSVTISFGTKKPQLPPSQSPKVQYDVYRPSDDSYDKYTDEDFLARNPLPDDFRVKICKTDDGLVQSVEKLKKNETFGECTEAIVFHEYGILDLGRLGLRKFQRGWYKLPNDTIIKIDFSENDITDITPELLNDLPSGVIFFNFAYNDIKIIKKNIINNSYIRKLEFDRNLLQEIEDNAFENTNLASLKVGGNRLDSLDFVKTLPKSMKILDLSDNSIFSISADTFKGLKELLRLKLIGCHIKTVEPGAFKDQGQLFALDLSYNRIRKLEPRVFKGLESLRTLDLGHNRIKKIERETFLELKKLLHLFINLGYNQIDTIGEGSFSDLHETTIHLDHNEIRRESIATGAFTGSVLRNLRLNNNLIARIDGKLLDGISELHSLYLEDNKIADIREGDIKYMENVMYLSLDRNPLRHLKNGAFYGLKQRHVTISVREVPIEDIQAGIFEEA